MRIYTNVAALRSVLHLDTADNKSSKSIERLSSGYKLNCSEDNPVGRALSKKMKMQIKSLERAEQNAADGISIVQSAEGALSEIQSMLQRMNELAVQASNDIYTVEDKESIQNEVDELLNEIDRVSKDTDFNGKSLLDGTLSRKAYAEDINGIEQMYISAEVQEGRYGFNVTGDAEKAEYTSAGIQGATVPRGAGGSVTINGVVVQIDEGEGIDSVYNKLKDASFITGIDMENVSGTAVVGQSIKFTQQFYGSNRKIEIECESDELANYLGMQKNVKEVGKDTEVSIIRTNTGFSATAKVVSEGEYLTFSDKGGFEMTVKVNAGTYENNKDANNEMRVAYNVTGAGAMTIQVGSNEGQSIEIDIPKITTETLGIAEINLKTTNESADAISKIGSAITRISEVRSYMGAYQNRMESTISSLGVTHENMTSALSRIEDVDMASEMTEYTTQNILSQAATSMLAQANQMPEKVLQLLQK